MNWRQEGKTTDCVARQYIGNLGKQTMVSSRLMLMGFRNITFPLSFKLFKPKSRLKEKRYL